VALVVELDPALQYVDHLERSFVKMWLAGEIGTVNRTNDVGHDTAMRGLPDPEVAIVEERTEAPNEDGVFDMRRNEVFGCHGLLRLIRAGERMVPSGA
jgi:hypothetical protein